MRLSLQQKEQFFHELSGGLVAGNSFRQIMERGTKRPTGARRTVAKALLESGDVSDGSAAAAFELVPEVFDPLDLAMIRAGEAAGKLDEVARTLSDYYRAIDRSRQAVLKQLVYPIFLLHFGILILAAPAAVSGGLHAWLREVGIGLGVAYVLLGGTALTAWWVTGRLDRSPWLERAVALIPGVGGLRRALVASRFSMVLAMLVRAGLGPISGFLQAGAASGSALFMTGASRVADTVRAGESLDAAVSEARCFPEGIRDAVHAAESTGRLDLELARVAAVYQETFTSRLESLAVWIPRLIYLAVMIGLAIKIFEIAKGYFGVIEQTFQ